MSFYNNNADTMVGATVQRIFMDQQNLKFVTDKGDFCYGVSGDCCSSSYFWDFLGVKKLLAGNPIIKVLEVEMDAPNDEDSKKGDVVSAYGYSFVTVDSKFGEVTSVMSFRNDSNGWYGGEMDTQDSVPHIVPEITDDVLEVN